MIYVCFGTNQKFHSRLIRLVTKSKWSHVWIEYPSKTWGGWWGADSSPHGVTKRPAEIIHKEYPKRICYKCEASLEGGFRWARKHINSKYDYAAFWNLFLYLLLKFTQWKFLWKIVARNSSKFTCSEFATGVLQASNITFSERLDAELTTPAMLQYFISTSDKFCYSKHLERLGDNKG